ncbi:MAG: hypothetical protein JJ897_13570 [Marinibacterium sp.]|nr:hypothetical protein [Marinibacterium sp.]
MLKVIEERAKRLLRLDLEKVKAQRVHAAKARALPVLQTASRLLDPARN